MRSVQAWFEGERSSLFSEIEAWHRGHAQATRVGLFETSDTNHLFRLGASSRNPSYLTVSVYG